MHRKVSIFTIVIISLFTIVLLQFDGSIGSTDMPPTKKLTLEEKNWLHNLKKPLKIGITHIPNQVILKAGQQPTGFSIDFFHQIEKVLDTTFDYVSFPTWKALIDAVKNDQIDIVFLAQKTENRLRYLNFTDTILSQQNKIIIRADNDQVSTIKDLYGKSAAIVKNSALYTYIEETFPQVRLVPVKTEYDALMAVLNAKAHATVFEPVRASAYMEEHNIKNLIIGGDFGYNYDLSIASRSNLPLLNIILSKAVNNVSPQVKKALYLKWGYVKDKEYFIDKQTLIYLLIAFGIILPFAIYLFWMNRSLRQEVLKRRRAEEEHMRLNQELEKRVKEEVEKRREQEFYMLEQDRLAQMGHMMNMIAHQWKQPLNSLSILTQSVVVKYHLSKLDDTYMESFKTKSKKQIDEMLNVMYDFMDFFKPKENEQFALHEIIEHALSIVEPALAVHDITITYYNDLTEDEIRYSNALGQVVVNILNNAKDALIERNIENREIEIRLFQNQEKRIISIEDNAGGIPNEIINEIFNPYFTTKNEKNGTGIGLYMSKMIVENHLKGELRVANSTRGACFQITPS